MITDINYSTQIMKYIANIVKICMSVLALSCIASCSEKQTVIIEEINLSKCLRPINLETTVENGNEIIFSWTVLYDAERYNLIIAKDDTFQDIVEDIIVSVNEVPYIKEVEIGNTYYFKVRAQAAGKEPSEWAVGEPRSL